MSYENEDIILPDDFQADTPQAEEVQEQEPVSEEVDTLETEQTEEEQPLTPEQLRFKVKYNHEEQELGYDEAVPLIQKGMNYDKVQQRIQELESDPRLSFVEELAQEQGMDVNEFLETVRNAREEQKLNELIQQNIPEEYAREILENKKFREQMKAEQQQKAEEEKKNAEFGEFFDYFRQANNRDYDPSKDQLPEGVLEAHNQGVPLKFAYMQHENSQLRSQLQTMKQNEENKKRAPVGSTTEYGGTQAESTDPFLMGFDSI